MDYRALFKGEYISAAEFGDRRPTMTIAKVELCKLEQEDGRQKDKGIIRFRETDRGWVLNRTNAECIAAMFGRETNDWVGKRVTLFSTPVKFGGKTEPGIRVKGSPDIAADVTVSIKLPRKKPQPMVLEVTRKEAKTATPASAATTETAADAPPPEYWESVDASVA